MIRAKNYETVSKFVKVMPRILWPLFFPDTVYMWVMPHVVPSYIEHFYTAVISNTDTQTYTTF